MNYEDLQKLIVDSVNSKGMWNRVVSLDIEADLKTLDEPKKPILSISTARRNANAIEIRKFVLESETVGDETRIFNEFGSFCEQVRPLVIIGYNIRRFDLPILSIKMRQLDELFKKDGRYQSGYWAFRDALTQSHVLDLINPVRFAIGRYDQKPSSFTSLENAIEHKRFQHLPFKKTKNIVSSLIDSSHNKWDVIYKLWKENRADFDRYIEGDVHDTLLLAEELFDVKTNS